MLDRALREVKEQVLEPMSAVGATLHPTQITLASGVFGVVAGLAAWQGLYVLAFIMWLVNRVLDGLDGTVARRYDKQSDLGAYIDIMVDNTVYAFIPLMLTLGQPTAANFTALGFLFASFYINSASWMYLSSLLEKRKSGASAYGEMTSVTMPGGIIEGTETILFYTLFLLLPNFIAPLFAAMGTLVLMTVAQRVVWATKHL